MTFHFLLKLLEDTSSKINKTVVNEYIKQLKDVVDGDTTELLKMAIRLPDAVTTERDEIDEEEWNLIANGINDAISKIVTYRGDEGGILKQDFTERISTNVFSLDSLSSLTIF